MSRPAAARHALPHLDVTADEPTAAPEEPEKPQDMPPTWRAWAYPMLRVWALLACGFLVGRITAPTPPPQKASVSQSDERAPAPALEKTASGAAAPTTAEPARPEQGRSIAGVVLDEAGKPIAGASISIAGPPLRPPTAAANTTQSPAGELGTTTGPVPAIPGGETTGPVLGPALTVSDATGAFSLRGVAAEALQVIASSPGFAPSAQTLEGEPTSTPVRITLRRAGTVEGAANDDKGNPLESVLIIGRAEDGLTVTAMSDGDGDFTLKGVRGKLQVQAFADAHVPASCDVTVEAGARVRCDFVLTRSVPQSDSGGRVAGYVLDSLGLPVVGASVWTDEHDASATTDERGEFVLANVAPGALFVVAEEKSAGTGQSGVVRAREGETLNEVRIYLPRRFMRSEPEATSQTAPKPKAQGTTSTVDNQLALELRAGKVMIALLATSASESGLQVGDVLEAIDGERVLSLGQARGMLRDPAGEPAKIRVARGRQRMTIRYRRPKL
jgi:hypothetical protein